jgi:hypothetical protein
MTKNIITFFLGLLFVSCSETPIDKDYYPKDTTVSGTNGTPKDSLSFYYPTTIQKDTQIFKTDIDTFMLNWFSSALYSAKEPILYNYYLGHDIYRFLWLRSFHRPVVFTLHRDGEKVWLTTKELDRQPNFMEISYVKFVPPIILPNGEIDTTESVRNDELPVDSVSKPDRKANIVLNETKQLSEKEWNEFEKLLNDYSFWYAKPYEESSGLDGSEWTIEGHLKNKYWFVNRWSPKDQFRKAGEYLINKSGLKEEIY